MGTKVAWGQVRYFHKVAWGPRSRRDRSGISRQSRVGTSRVGTGQTKSRGKSCGDRLGISRSRGDRSRSRGDRSNVVARGHEVAWGQVRYFKAKSCGDM